MGNEPRATEHRKWNQPPKNWFSFLQLEPNIETLSANKTLRDDAEVQQWLDPGGSNRDVTLPAEESRPGTVFIIVNTADAAETLTVKNDAGGTVATIDQNEMALLTNSGATWRSLVGTNT